MSEVLPCRTVAEAHLYLDLAGWPRPGRTHRLEERGGRWLAIYEAVVDGHVHKLVFEAPNDVSAHGDALGGSTPSRLIDPGQFVAHAARLAASLPLDPEDVDPSWRAAGTSRLSLAAKCVDEALKFVPAAWDRVPPEAFFTAEGRAVAAAEPGRFERDRLQAVAEAYRDVARRWSALPEAAIRPVLVAPGWEGLAYAVTRPLMPLDGAPSIAWAWDPTPLRAYVSEEVLERLGTTVDRLADEALARIARHPPPTRISEIARPGRSPLRVVVADGEYAAEQVLNAAFLRDVATDLGAAGPIAVAVPYRGVLLASALADATDGDLLTMARNLHAKAAGEAVTAWVFIVRDGVIEGRVISE